MVEGGMAMPQVMQNLIQQYVIEIKKIYGLHLRKVILYGSYARGDFQSDSDVDIMILSYMTFDFNMDHDLDIKPIAKSESHFEKWVTNYPFYANINKEGVVLYGAA